MTMLLRLRNAALVRRALSYSLGTTLYKLHIVVLVPLFAFAFSAAEAGRVELAMFAAGFMTAIATANLGTVVSQRYAQSEPAGRNRELGLGVTSVLAVSAVGLVLAVAMTRIVAVVVPELSDRLPLVLLALLGGVLNALVANLCLFFQLKSAPRAFNVTYALWATIVVVGTGLYLWLIAPRGDSFVLATLIAGVVCSIVAVAWFWPELQAVLSQPDRANVIRRSLVTDLRRASRLFLLIILTWALLFLDRKLLASLAGVEEVGAYGLAVRIANGVTLVLGPLQAAWWDASMNQTPAESRHSLRVSLRAHGLVMLTFVGAAVLAAQGSLPSLLGDWFGPGVRYIPILIVCATLISTAVLPYALLTRAGNYRAIVGAYAIAVAVNVAANLLLDGRFGAAGACAANLLAYVALNIAAAWPIRYEIIAALGPSRRSVAVTMSAGATLAIAALVFPGTILTGY